jgi:hypothetical protein
MTHVWINACEISILSAIAEDDLVVLSGWSAADDESDDSTACAIYLPRQLFIEMANEIVDIKANYNKVWNGEFCGEGQVNFTVTRWPDVELPDANGKLGPAPSYLATEFAVDMEHG